MSYIYKKIHYMTITLVTQNVAQVPFTSYELYTWKVWSCHVQPFRGICIYKKIYVQNDKVNVTQNVAPVPSSLWPWLQGHTKCCPLPSTLCDLYTCIVWSCYVQWFRRRCNYKKIHYSTFDLRVKVTRNIAQYPIYHAIHTPVYF